MMSLRRAWIAWKRFGRKVGDFQARVLLGVFYFVVLTPFALAMRGADPMRLRHPSPGWRPRPETTPDDPVAHARRQFS
jgi:hypothetical protein